MTILLPSLSIESNAYDENRYHNFRFAKCGGYLLICIRFQWIHICSRSRKKLVLFCLVDVDDDITIELYLLVQVYGSASICANGLRGQKVFFLLFNWDFAIDRVRYCSGTMI